MYKSQKKLMLGGMLKAEKDFHSENGNPECIDQK